MLTLFTYQVSGTNQLENHNELNDGISNQLLEEIEEVDDDSVLVLPKKKQFRKIVDTLDNKDSISYGVKNLENLPIRVVEISENDNETTQQVVHLFEPNFKTTPYESWQTIILVLAAALIGLAKAFSVSRFKQTVKSVFNYRVAREVCSEEKVFFHRVNIILTINYLMITSLLIYQFRTALNFNLEGVSSFVYYLLILSTLLGIYIVKMLFPQLVTFIFNVQNICSDYLFNITLFNNLLGIILIPVIALMYFTTLDYSILLIYLVIPILVFIFIIRLIRLFIIGKSKSISYFYIFLYICTLEILPLVVMIKFFILK